MQTRSFRSLVARDRLVKHEVCNDLFGCNIVDELSMINKDYLFLS